MDKPPPLGLSFPPHRGDEAAYEIAEFLQALSLAFDERYFAQIRRHDQAIHPKRSELVDPPWKGDR